MDVWPNPGNRKTGKLRDRAWRLALSAFETVTGSAHGLEKARVLCVFFHLFADTTDVHVHRARRHEAGVAPDGIEQLVTGEDTDDASESKSGATSDSESVSWDSIHGAGLSSSNSSMSSE